MPFKLELTKAQKFFDDINKLQICYKVCTVGPSTTLPGSALKSPTSVCSLLMVDIQTDSAPSSTAMSTADAPLWLCYWLFVRGCQ